MTRGRRGTMRGALLTAILFAGCSNGGSAPPRGEAALEPAVVVLLDDRTFEAAIVASLPQLERRALRVLTDLGFAVTPDTRMETGGALRFEATDGSRIVYVDLRPAPEATTRMRIEAARVSTVVSPDPNLLESDNRLAREVAERIASGGSTGLARLDDR